MDDDDDYDDLMPKSPKRSRSRQRTDVESPRSPKRSRSREKAEALDIKEFDLPSVESLNKLSKVQVVDFALQHTTPELLLSCLKKNVNDDQNAIKALEDINKMASQTDADDDVDDLMSGMMEGLTLADDSPKTAVAVKPAAKPAAAAKPEKAQCKGIKKDGKQCANKAVTGSKYCKIHAKQKTPPQLADDSGAVGAVAGGGQIFVQPTEATSRQASPNLENLYREKVRKKNKLMDALMEEEDKDMKKIYKEEITALKTAIEDIAEQLIKQGKNPNLLAFGKNKFASTTNNMKMPGPAISSKMYGIQMAPPQYVDSNQMVWPINMPLGGYYEPNLRNVMRDYPGPTGGRSPTLPPQSAAKMESQFRAAQSRISFGRKRRSKRRSAKRRTRRRRSRLSKKR